MTIVVGADGTRLARFLVWTAAGLSISFAYGMRRSRLRRGEVRNPEAEPGG